MPRRLRPWIVTLNIRRLSMLLRLPEAAAQLQVSRATLYRIIEAGALKPVKIGGATRFRAEDIERIRSEGCDTRRKAE